jgi:hypothetical protein
MDNQDRQPIWHAVRAQCAMIGQYAHLHEEELPTAEGLRLIVVELLEILEQVLRADLSPEEDVEDLDPASVQAIVNTLHESAAVRGDVARGLTEAERAEARADDICRGIITRVFNVWVRQS